MQCIEKDKFFVIIFLSIIPIPNFFLLNRMGAGYNFGF
jgi:hypothetical protein